MNEKRFFQWVLGDRKGEVMIFNKIEVEGADVYITFKDNSRINETFVAPLNQKDLTGKLMAEIDSPTNCWKFKEEVIGEETGRVEQDAESGVRYEVPSVTEIASDGQKLPVKKKKVTLIPPRPSAPRSSNFGIIEVEKPIFKTNIDASDPVYILMSKAKKIDNEISMNITISLPPKSLYDIAKESFDNGDEKFIQYIVEEVTTDEIKNALKKAIREMYEQVSNI